MHRHNSFSPLVALFSFDCLLKVGACELLLDLLMQLLQLILICFEQQLLFWCQFDFCLKEFCDSHKVFQYALV